MKSWWWPLAVLWVLCSSRAPGQSVSVGSGVPELMSHGWVVLPADDGWLLAHVPPREASPGVEAAPPGSVRPARPLAEMPDCVAAVGDRVFLLFPPRFREGRSERSVLTLRAEPAGIGGLWVDLPSGGFESRPALPARGRLVDVVVAGGQLHALQRAAGSIVVQRLGAQGWADLPTIPALVGEEPRAVAMVAIGDRPVVAAQFDQGTLAWSWHDGASWELLTLADWERFWSASWRRGWGDEVVLGVPDEGGQQTVWAVGERAAWELGELPSIEGGGVVLLASSGRLVAVGREPESDDAKGVVGAARSAEMSLVTGRVVFDGAAPQRVPVTADEFRMIVGMLLLVMVAALLVIVRPGSGASWGVPDGWALADPGRRMLASLVDGLLMAWIVGRLFGVSARAVVTLEVVVHPDGSWLALPATMLAGWLVMSVLEASFGATPGKWIFGLRVWRARAGVPQRVTLFWCLVRNAIKWLIPPVAAMAVLDPDGRHRGDGAARAVVGLRVEEPGADGSKPGD
jgi:uncharacterized RDD family membrane protein YckC